MNITPIGTIHTPFDGPAGIPIQPAGAHEVEGRIELDQEYRAGLKDLHGFSHIILLYHFHRSSGFDLHLVPFMDSEPRGVFATRAPRRPNPIGLSIVEVARVEDGAIHVRNVDVLDGTPLIDIKPYVPEFDSQVDVRTGWLERVGQHVSTARSDDRFQKG